MLKVLTRIFSVAAMVALGGTLLGQTASDFIVPSSSKPHTTGGQRAFHSNYVIYTGTWNYRSGHGPFSDLLSLAGVGPAQSSIPGYHPSDILSAYDIPANGGTEAIAVVDAYDLPTNLHDFNVFAGEFGLPQETSTNPTASSNRVFQVVYPTGVKPAVNGSWDGEIALDMEWAHAIAPNAKIYLIECASDGVDDLLDGAQYAAENLPNVKIVSMSFGATEFTAETQFDSIFTQAGITFLAAAGDTPNVATYPATSPNVISVGGTSLTLSGGAVESETYWYTNKEDGGSAGPSKIEPRPAYQNPFATLIGRFKGNPDVAADADPSTGCSVYVSSEVTGTGSQPVSGWLVIGGTSLACPIVAGITDDRADFAPTSYAELTTLYSLVDTSAFRQIVSGNSGVYFTAPGYNLCDGLGAPLGLYTDTSLKFSSGSLVTGVGISGIPDNMSLKDNHIYEVRSSISGVDQVAAVGATFTGAAPGSSARGGTVAVTGLNTAETVQVSALNVTTGDYDVLGTIPLTYTISTKSLAISAITNYVSTSGAIKLRVSAIDTGTANQCRLGIDQIALVAQGPI